MRIWKALRPKRSWVRSLLDLFTIATSTLLLAFVALVVEDITLPSDGQVTAPFLWLRRDISLLLLIVVWVAVYLQRRLRRIAGTLFYIQFLESGMSNWHQVAKWAVNEQSLSARSVVERWSGQSPAPGIDFTGDVQRLRRRLENAMNEDDHSTRYHLAPNLRFPVSLALGGQLDPPPDTWLWELDGDRRLAFPFPTAWEHDDRLEVKDSKLQSGAGAVAVVLNITNLDQFAQDPRMPWAGTIYHTEPSDQLRQLTLKQRRWWWGFMDRLPFVQRRNQRDGIAIVTGGAWATHACDLIRTALCQNPGKRVYLIARLPKSVALATGYMLRESLATPPPPRPERGDPIPAGQPLAWAGCQKTGCAGCSDVWARLTPVLFQGSQFVAPRVHEGQPPADELETYMRADGLTPIPTEP